MRIGEAQRRARIGRRHLLAAKVSDPAGVASAMVALHGTDPSTVYLSVWARMVGGDVPAVERALYDDRSLMRVLCMRRTVFVVPVEVAPAVLAACSRTVAARERKKLVSWLTESGVAEDVDAWLADVEGVMLRAVAERGEATANELSSADARLRTEIVLGQGSRNEATVRVGSRVLLVLAAQGHVVRGRPLGSWTSTQFRWSPVDVWFPGGLTEVSIEDAENDLARRYLRTFGPASVDDLRWWAGWTATQTKKTLARIKAVEVELDAGTGVLLADDLEPEQQPEPWVALLPALDPTPMGWTRRDFYLGEHAERLFDLTGNVSPTVWADGRIVGGWAQRKDGEVAIKLLEDLGADARTAIKQAAASLGERLGDVRLTARARGASPVEKELLA